MKAHRPSTVRNAAETVMPDHGRVVERAKRAELLARNAVYALNYRLSQDGVASTGDDAVASPAPVPHD